MGISINWRSRRTARAVGPTDEVDRIAWVGSEWLELRLTYIVGRKQWHGSIWRGDTRVYEADHGGFTAALAAIEAAAKELP